MNLVLHISEDGKKSHSPFFITHYRSFINKKRNYKLPLLINQCLNYFTPASPVTNGRPPEKAAVQTGPAATPAQTPESK